MADRPSFYTFIDRQLTNIDPNYAENALNFTGFKPNQAIPSKIHNTLWLTSGLWQAYLDYGFLALKDYVDASVNQRWSSDKLEYPTGPGASVTTGGGVGPTTNPVYYFEGYRVCVDDMILKTSGASPLLQPAVPTPGRIWLYLSVGTIADPSFPFASVRVELVAAGTADNPQANELTLRGLDIDALGDITANVDAITQVPEPEERVVYSTRQQEWNGPTKHNDTATFTAAGGNSVVVEGRVEIDGTGFGVFETLTVMSATGPVGSSISNTAGVGLVVAGVDAARGALEGNNTGAGPSVRGVKTVAGAAVEGDATTGGGTGVRGLGGAFGVEGDSDAGVGVSGTTITGSAVTGTSSGIGTGVVGQGGPSVASRAGIFLGGHVDAVSLLAQSAGGASSTAIALSCVGNGAATGLQALSTDGYGLVARSDLTSPTRSAARFVPQDDDPTTPQQGDFFYNSARGPSGTLRNYKVVWESLHTSPKGYVFDRGLLVSGSILSGNSVDVSLAQVQPEEVGEVIVTATGSLTWSNDAGVSDIQLLDVTAGNVIINNGGVGISIAANVGAAIRDQSFITKVPYTLPDATLRTFAVRITSGGATTTYEDVFVTVEGVY